MIKCIYIMYELASNQGDLADGCMLVRREGKLYKRQEIYADFEDMLRKEARDGGNYRVSKNERGRE